MSDVRFEPNRPIDPVKPQVDTSNARIQTPPWMKWVYVLLVTCLVGGLLAFAFTKDEVQVTTNPRPGVSTPAETTGSGGGNTLRP